WLSVAIYSASFSFPAFFWGYSLSAARPSRAYWIIVCFVYDLKLCGQWDEAKLALPWGTICCYPYIMDGQQNASVLLDLVHVLDQILMVEPGDIAGLPRLIW
ncbi:hypothetical protein Ancab_005547, partial [Ancistrocladus abbreviatus]